MSKLDRHLNRYKAKTEVDPPKSLESDVWEKINTQQSVIGIPGVAPIKFRTLAISIGFFVGLFSTNSWNSTSTTDQQTTGLTVFAPDATHLPSTWIAKQK